MRIHHQRSPPWRQVLEPILTITTGSRRKRNLNIRLLPALHSKAIMVGVSAWLTTYLGRQWIPSRYTYLILCCGMHRLRYLEWGRRQEGSFCENPGDITYLQLTYTVVYRALTNSAEHDQLPGTHSPSHVSSTRPWGFLMVLSDPLRTPVPASLPGARAELTYEH